MYVLVEYGLIEGCCNGIWYYGDVDDGDDWTVEKSLELGKLADVASCYEAGNCARIEPPDS